MPTLYARGDFQYDDDTFMFRGQIFELKGYRNDPAIRRTLAGVYEGDETYKCGTCGREFIAPGLRDDHGRRAHPDRPKSKSARAAIEEEEKDQELIPATV